MELLLLQPADVELDGNLFEKKKKFLNLIVRHSDELQ